MSGRVKEVEIGPLRPERFEEALEAPAYQVFLETIRSAGPLFEGRKVVNVNSTARGGGVAEMLASLLAYARGAGVDARWLVITGRPDFFHVTKRIHNNLHGAPGDGGPLGDEEHRIYEETLGFNVPELTELISPRDIVLLHDPQTAGLVTPLKGIGATVMWRCHVGLDTPNAVARGAWEFLRRYVEPADRYIFSRQAFAWENLVDDKIVVIPPSIDAFSPKNQEMSAEVMRSILVTTGLMQGTAVTTPGFIKVDGTHGRVTRATEMYGAGPFGPETPLVVQVSRWDRLKDPLGVIRGFVDHIAPAGDAHLVLAGPAVAAVSDDPEGAEVLEECRDAWSQLPEEVAGRIHLACLPMDDGQENAAIVNALQRRADVIVQKSLAEGFGLTVAEGMWKGRPVVASRIGGIQDQIEDGVSGVLIDDPSDLAAYGKAVAGLLNDPEKAEQIGRAAQARVRDEFLGPRHLMQYMELIAPFIT
ncbi:MAG: glycosyltransferase [Actinomycetota bacterium]